MLRRNEYLALAELQELDTIEEGPCWMGYEVGCDDRTTLLVGSRATMAMMWCGGGIGYKGEIDSKKRNTY